MRRRHTILTGSVILLMLMSTTGWSEEPSKAYKKAKSAAIKQAKSAQDEHQKTLKALARIVQQAKTKPDLLFAWAQNHIQFEPYQGALRGHKGALTTKQANAADMALLMANLYKQAGYKVRFATGMLPDKRAQAILQQLAGKDTLEGPLPRGFKPPTQYQSTLTQVIQRHIWLEVAKQGTSWQAVDPIASDRFGQSGAARKETDKALFQWARAKMTIALEGKFSDATQKDLLTIKGDMGDFAYKTMSLAFKKHPTIQWGVIPSLAVGKKRTDGQYFAYKPKLISLTIRMDFKLDGQRRVWHETIHHTGLGLNLFAQQLVDLTITIVPGWTNAAMIKRLGLDILNDSKIQNPQRMLVPLTYLSHLDTLMMQMAGRMGIIPILRTPRLLLTATTKSAGGYDMHADLLGDQVDVITALGLPQKITPAFFMLYGHLKDTLKSALFRYVIRRPVITTSSLFSSMQQNKVPVMTVHTSTSNKIKSWFTGSLEQRLQMKLLAVKHGAILLTSRSPVPTKTGKQLGWWRFDPLTHRFYGQMSTGLLSSPSTKTEASNTTAEDLAVGQLNAWRAVEDTQKMYTNTMCASGDNLLRIGRAMCATTKAIQLPTIAQCLSANTTESTTDNPLAIKTPTCEEATTEARCGAVLAHAFLNNILYRASLKQQTTTTSPKGEVVSSMKPPVAVCQAMD